MSLNDTGIGLPLFNRFIARSRNIKLLRFLIDVEGYWRECAAKARSTVRILAGPPGTGKCHFIQKATKEHLVAGLSVAIAPLNNALRKEYCRDIVKWVVEVQSAGSDIPATIVFVGPDEQDILSDAPRGIFHVPFPRIDEKYSVPGTAGKPLLVVGCVERIATWAAGAAVYLDRLYFRRRCKGYQARFRSTK